MTARNIVVKKHMKNMGVRQWEVAEKFGVTERTASVWMRKELPPERKAVWMRYIDEIAEEHKAELEEMEASDHEHD